MRIVAHTILGTLDQAAQHDRAALLDAGSAAAALFCHPNTVRDRLRRLQEQTGRSLSEPHGIAELTLAFEVDRWITGPAH